MKRLLAANWSEPWPPSRFKRRGRSHPRELVLSWGTGGETHWIGVCACVHPTVIKRKKRKRKNVIKTQLKGRKADIKNQQVSTLSTLWNLNERPLYTTARGMYRPPPTPSKTVLHEHNGSVSAEECRETLGRGRIDETTLGFKVQGFFMAPRRATRGCTTLSNNRLMTIKRRHDDNNTQSQHRLLCWSCILARKEQMYMY